MEQIEKIKKANEILEKELDLENTFYDYEREHLFPTRSVRLEDKIAQNKVRIFVLEWFDTIKTSNYTYNFSKYIDFYLDDMPRCGFELTDEIESKMYDKVWSSHSDLFAMTNHKIRELIESYCNVSEYEGMWKNLNEACEWDIKDPRKYADIIINNLNVIIKFLKSDTMKKLNVYIEGYIDDMIKTAEESDY